MALNSRKKATSMAIVAALTPTLIPRDKGAQSPTLQASMVFRQAAITYRRSHHPRLLSLNMCLCPNTTLRITNPRRSRLVRRVISWCDDLTSLNTRPRNRRMSHNLDRLKHRVTANHRRGYRRRGITGRHPRNLNWCSTTRHT